MEMGEGISTLCSHGAELAESVWLGLFLLFWSAWSKTLQRLRCVLQWKVRAEVTGPSTDNCR